MEARDYDRTRGGPVGGGGVFQEEDEDNLNALRKSHKVEVKSTKWLWWWGQ